MLAPWSGVRFALSAVLRPGLRPRARIAFAVLWIAGQGALVLTASRRDDQCFGFRMFPEASRIEVHLVRDVGGRSVPTAAGEWSATDASGQLRHFSWRDRVRDPELRALDQRIFASYGAETQLARLQRALDDVAAHIPEDGETKRLRAEVTVWKNGHDPVTRTLESRPREVP